MTRPRIPLPKGVPRTLRFQSVTFDVVALGDGRLAFAYYDGSRRIVVKRRTLDELREEAERLALSILNAETAARDLTAEQRRTAASAFATLEPTPLHLDAVARDAAEAFKITKGAISLSDLARFWAGRNPTGSCPLTSAVLDELLAAMRERQRSAIYMRDLKRDLTPFATLHADLSNVGERDIAAFLRTRGDIGTRRRDNIRDAIVRLFRFAQDQHYLAQDRKTEAEKVPRLDEGIAEVTTYTPDEIRILLANLKPVWRPWFVIAAFAGLRTSEIFRLDWHSVKLAERLIVVGKRVAKKVKISRKVPIQDNLAEFLAEYADRMGPIYPNQETHGTGPSWRALESRHARAIASLASGAGLTWERNALRHSYGSHRLAIIKSEPQLVVEMGNSISQVREHYHDPKSEAEARAYFDIRPANHANVLYLPLRFAS